MAHYCVIHSTERHIELGILFFRSLTHIQSGHSYIANYIGREMSKYDELDRQGLFLFHSGNITPDMKIGKGYELDQVTLQMQMNKSAIEDLESMLNPLTTSEINVSDIFTTQIQNPSFIIEQFHKTKLLDVDEFESEEEYRNALGQLALDMNVVAPDI